MNKIFVFDTNTLISAFLFPHSIPRKALNKALEEGKVFASPKTQDELQGVFLRPKFDKYVLRENRLSVLNEFAASVMIIDVIESISACRDPKDNKFLELAVAANAACIVSGDEDLLILDPFRNIPILNAADFLVRF